MEGSFHAKVRPPTSLGWLVSAVVVILTGELHRATGSAVPQVFGRPMTPDQMYPWFLASAVVMVACLSWLASLYLAPGHLTIDTESGILELRRRENFGFTTVHAPLKDWDVRVVYFSDLDERRRAFKRVEFRSPEAVHVLLFGDIKPAAALPDALDAVSDALGAYDVQLEHSPKAKDPQAAKTEPS